MVDFRAPLVTPGTSVTPSVSLFTRAIVGKEINHMNRCLSFAGGSLRSNNASAVVTKPVEMKVYDLSEQVLSDIISSIASKKPEQGGALGADMSTGKITRFYFDDQGSRNSVEYSPDAAKITDIINDWEQENIAFCGMIHSHPGQFCQPSEGDFRYAKRILAAMPQTLKGSFLMPILTINAKHETAHIAPYIVCADEKGVHMEHTVFTVDGQQLPDQISIKAQDVCEASSSEDAKSTSVPPTVDDAADQNAAPDYSLETIFQRNASILPLDELSERTVVIVGCGGARGFCESLTRSGVGRIILVDGDTVSVTNAATQGTYLDEIGLYKTEVIANTLRRINPHMQIVEYRHFLDDTVSDEMMAEVIGLDLLASHPEHVLLCGCTDNFPAQDRTVKLALKWGVPYLASQTYAEGRGGEVIFTFPGVTSTCPRCMLSSRYDAYNADAKNDVTSKGAPIYSTDRLNALKSHIAMMLLLYGTSSRLGSELDALKDRNLVLVSFAADCEEKLGIRAFSRTMSALGENERAAMALEETVWLPQKPDRPENGFHHCPYCAGTGDLRLVKGLNADTRKPYDLSGLISAILPVASSSDVELDSEAGKGGE